MVVGVVREPRALDAHGWAAGLEVERSLAGPLAPGARIRIAWEELARRRPARFRDGGRVLVALDPLPRTTLWRKRLPDASGIWAVAADGEAFLRDPDPRTLAAVAAYLALPEEDRAGSPGVAALARIAEEAAPPIASAAVDLLAAIPALERKLDATAGARLARVLADGARPPFVRRRLLQLVERRRLTPLRPAVAAVAAASDPLRAEALAALATLDGGLPHERVAALLESDDAAVRAVAARAAAGTPVEERLPALVTGDPAPAVRLAAAEALLDAHGAAALDAVAPALFDPDPTVRGRTAIRIGRLGAPAVALLDRLAREHTTPEEAAAPLVALSEAGPWGRDALRALAADHPDERVRAFARLLLHEDPRGHH